MAIDKLFNSLNAGASDLRLTGDQTQRGTYTQRRRDQMAYGGIAGLDGRKRYGIGSWIQEKIMDPIKENPITSAVIGGGLLNQFGIPFTGKLTESGDPFGQNWLGNLLGQVNPDWDDMVIGKTPSEKEEWLKMLGKAGATGVINPHADTASVLGEQNITDLLNKAREPGIIGTATNWIRDQFGNVVDAVTGQKRSSADEVTKGGQEIRWKMPMALGAAAGLAQQKYIEDQPPFPMDETGIRFQTAKEVMADPEQRFKPQEQYVLPSALAAEGGRIGYAGGGNGAGVHDPLEQLVYLMGKKAQGTITSQESDTLDRLIDETGFMSQKKAQGGRIGFADKGFVDKIPENLKPDTDNILKNLLDFRKKKKKYDDAIFESERIDAAEGGLMNLGGMEKDYRQEGGFVPIGGQEKADDVPARLSKNEFVFTADAVRAAGGGDIDAGAEVMENVMKNLEAGGEVSEESQGLEGARGMFANAQELEKRII